MSAEGDGTAAADTAFVFPASFGQQRLWFLAEAGASQTGAYHIPAAIRLDGSLDRTALQRAVNEIVARHESLRTGLRFSRGELQQIVSPSLGVAIPVLEVGEEEVAGLVAREAGRPFVLERAPLLRLVLLRLARERHVLLLVFHHLVADGWSLRVFVAELAQAYAAYAAGQQPQLPEPKLQYADYAVWQRDWLAGDQLQPQLAYWREQLAELPPLELPLDHPRPAQPSYRGRTHSTRLPAPLLERLAALAAAERATPYITLLAALHTLLGRYSGQTDFALGSPIANRTRPELEQLIGPVENLVLLRGQVGGAQTFRELVARSRSTLDDAEAHSDVPFEVVADELGAPPVRVVVSYDEPLPAAGFPGLAVAPLEVESAGTPFDLRVAVRRQEDGVDVQFDYAAELLGAETVARLADDFARLLERAAASPDEPVSSLLPPRAAHAAPRAPRPAPAAETPTFSIFFFSADGSRADRDKYRLVIESARFADAAGFEAVWLPERHFDPFGGLYPNPAVLAAAVARETKRIAIRAGSVVLPLHEPIRVAEEWSAVDNLSGGRVGISFASGWHPNDFLLAPARWEDRRESMFREIETVKTLWRGGSITAKNGVGADVPVRIFPRPLQDDLPTWVTSTSAPDTWVRAAQIGANMLTALLQQTVEEVAEKIALYRSTLAEHGYDPESRRVTMMLHTLVGDDFVDVRRTIDGPMRTYVRSHLELFAKSAAQQDVGIDVDQFTDDDREALVDLALDRYLSTSALFGDYARARTMVDRLAAIGVDEVAALIDFGVETDAVLAGLGHLDAVRRRPASEGA